MKKALLVIIDALSSRVVHNELQESNLPTMQALITASADGGGLRAHSLSVFPSLTFAATPALATGVYPRQHGVMGSYWYDHGENRVVYFGGDPWVVIWQGLGRILRDFLINLNHHWLSHDTIFQRVEQANKQAASVNWFVYHGLVEHKVNSTVLDYIMQTPAEMPIKGPSFLHLGDFITTDDWLGDDTPRGGLLQRFGITDKITGELLLRLAEKRMFPDFTLAYFPDNDFQSHKVGAQNAAETLHTVDQYLGDMIEAYGGLDAFLADIAILITGDHSQSDILSDKGEAAIDLTHILEDFKVTTVGETRVDEEQLIVCPDGRVASIYVHEGIRRNIPAIVRLLSQDPRVDQVLCRANRVDSGQAGYYVYGSDGAQLHFDLTDNNAMGRDVYGGTWRWSGELGVLGESDRDGDTLIFPDYPNAFERIAMLLSADRAGDIWVTAQSGYEFIVPGVPVHAGGGSHGALHVLDSCSPLITAGLPDGVIAPEHPRAVDMVPLCMAIMGLLDDTGLAGKSHAMNTR